MVCKSYLNKVVIQNKMKQNVNAKMARCSRGELNQVLTRTFSFYNVTAVSWKTPTLGLQRQGRTK